MKSSILWEQEGEKVFASRKKKKKRPRGSDLEQTVKNSNSTGDTESQGSTNDLSLRKTCFATTGSP
jgi:hypothetical protein